jgi:hypothetical protein
MSPEHKWLLRIIIFSFFMFCVMYAYAQEPCKYAEKARWCKMGNMKRFMEDNYEDLDLDRTQLIKDAKKEVFDDVEDLFESHKCNPDDPCDCGETVIDHDDFDELKKKHLGD